MNREVRVHLRSAGDHLRSSAYETACCERTDAEIPEADTFTRNEADVTCTVGQPPTLRERLAAAATGDLHDTAIKGLQAEPNWGSYADALLIADRIIAALPTEAQIRSRVSASIVPLSHDLLGSGRRWRSKLTRIDQEINVLTALLARSIGNPKENG